MNALELSESDPVQPATFVKAVAFLQANYGTEYSPEKITTLFAMIKEEDWSEHRFTETFKWFIKNKSFPSWTIADWFQYGIKVYPYEWYLLQQNKAGIYTNVLDQMDVYELNGVRMYKWKDGHALPFAKIERIQKEKGISQ